MDPSPLPNSPSVEEDEWDTDGYVIPSLGIEEPGLHSGHSTKDNTKPAEVQVRKEENIYLGPHGAPPSQSRQVGQNSFSRKQRLKQTLKEADRRYTGTGRENKVDHLRELVGGVKMPATAAKSLPRDWLDPHCHESQFERRHQK